MWGYPFMVFAVGLDPAFASAMLTVMVMTGLVVGPVLGLLTVRHPLRRSNLALGVVVLMALAWGAVLLWPEPVPAWLIVVLAVSLGIGGPASQIGFDYARTFNPPRRLGSANGIVNVGGFTASFVMMLLIGLVLDLQRGEGGPLYSLEAFRLAELVQIPVVAVGVIGLLLARHRTRRLLEEEEGIQVGPLWVALARAWGRRRAR
jgi:nitrate/nitrite transporter NarK